MTLAIAIIEFIGVIVAFFVGRKQGRDNERAYQLSLNQATPRIGTRMEFSGVRSQDIAHRLRYSIKTTIYNDGSLVASNLEGNWKLSSSYDFLNSTEVIRADSLPSARPIELNHDLGYHLEDTWTKPEVVLQVDLNLVYLGFGNAEKKYQVTYKYDPKSRKMIQSIQ